MAFWKDSFFCSSLGCNLALTFELAYVFFYSKKFHMYIKCTLIIFLPFSFFILFSLSLNFFFASNSVFFFLMCSMLLIRLPAQAGVRSYLLEQGQLPSSYTTKKDDSSFPGIRQLACSSRGRVRTLWSCPRPWWDVALPRLVQVLSR